MNSHNFIFSNQARYRISRHVIFWLLWFLFMLLTVHIPGNRFANWQIEFTQAQREFVEKKGGMFNFFLTMTWRQSWVLLCHIAFTYALIYYILPRYYASKKKWISTTGILLLLFTVLLVLLYGVQNLISLHNGNQNTRLGLPFLKGNTWAKVKVVVFQTTFNLATVVGIAVAIKLMKRWWLKQRETALITREKANAELQLLKAQVHPHFLFNSLNNIYSFALEGSSKAPEMIKKLSGLLHYMLYDCKQPLVPLEKELNLINDYISLEKIRYGDRLKIDIQMPSHIHPCQIAPLLLIPFVENSFKHGSNKMLAHPYVMLNISILDGILHFKLTNSKPSGIEEIGVNGNRGLGLKNVKKRLELLYSGRHELQIVDEPSSYAVWLKITLAETIPGKIKESFKKEIPVYELA